MCGRGWLKWRLPPVDPMANYTGDTCGSHATFFLDNVALSCSCTFQVLIRPYGICSSCSTCYFFIGPCAVLLLVHVTIFYSIMRHDNQITTIHSSYISNKPMPEFHILSRHMNSPHQTSIWVHTPNHKCPLHQAHMSLRLRVTRAEVRDTLKELTIIFLLLFSELLKLTLSFLSSFSVDPLVRRGQPNFLFSNKQALSQPISLFEWTYLYRYQNSSKKGSCSCPERGPWKEHEH